MLINLFSFIKRIKRPSRWPRGLRCRSATACLLVLRFRIPREACLSVLWLLCVVTWRSLRRADHSSTGVLPTVVRRYLCSRNLMNETIALVGLQRQKIKCNNIYKPQQTVYFKNYMTFVQLLVSIHTESSSGFRARPLKHSSKVNIFFGKISGVTLFLMPRRESRLLMCLILVLNSSSCPSMLNKTPLRHVWKVHINLFMYVCLPVYTHGTTCHPLDGFSRSFALWSCYLNIFRKFKFG